MIQDPFFLVGAERSGTTLLRLMLDHHPHIACHFEFEHAVELVGDDGHFPTTQAYREWLANSRSFVGSGARLDPALEYAELVDSFLEQKRERGGKQIVGATVHKHFDRLRFIWPRARFVHIVRDPRDVAPSCMAMGWAGNVWGGVQRWLDAEQLWDTMASRIEPSHRYEIRYEDLIRDARKQLAGICEFLGITFEDEMFSYAAKSSYGLPDPGRVEVWREKASARELALVEFRCGDLLARRGYRPSGHPRIEVSPRDQAMLEEEDRRLRRAFRIKRYGLLLLAAENVSRRLPLEPLHPLFVRRMQAIDEQFIQ